MSKHVFCLYTKKYCQIVKMFLSAALPSFLMLVLTVCTFYLLRSWTRSDREYYMNTPSKEPTMGNISLEIDDSGQCKPECCVPPNSSQVSCSRGCICKKYM